MCQKRRNGRALAGDVMLWSVRAVDLIDEIQKAGFLNQRHNKWRENGGISGAGHKRRMRRYNRGLGSRDIQ